jgi:DNA-directed RNA polymerase specialized sigma subunit
MSRKPTDREFQKLAERVKNAIVENEGLIGDQKEQVELVMSLERKFKNDVCKYARCVEVYRLFIDYVYKDLGNILSSQGYFRETGETFNKKISPILKEKNPHKLMEFNINYQFIKFIVDNWGDQLPERAQKYYNKFLYARNILIENNIPLAINRAKTFYRKTPRSHLGLLDLIDICISGLIVGIDKYAEEKYNTVWRSVCIGRMVGFMIEEYSKSFIRLFPSDKKILYRANALRQRLKIEKIEDLVDAVNESFEKDKKEGKNAPKLPISEIHIRTLLNSSGYISADSRLDNDGEEGLNIYDYTPDEDSVEDNVERKDTIIKVYEASKNLTKIEKKIIRLKGVNI